MARKKRIWYPGAIYHIMCRGNHRHEIFRDGEDYQVYLTTLMEAKKMYKYNLYSYCLMTNHVHLQIETSDIDIGTVMKFINMNYAIYFNKKYKFVGHLFQGRYRSELIEKDAYNLEISRYIHLNPVKAKMVEHPLEYEWSSYHNFFGKQQKELVTTEKILNYFNGNDPILYKQYVEYNLG